MIDKKKIGAWFDKRGLWNKPFNAWTEDEINGLITAILSSPDSHVPPHGWEKPYINQAGELIIPRESHPRYHWFASGQSIMDTLRELNAPQEIMDKYVSNFQGVAF